MLPTPDLQAIDQAASRTLRHAQEREACDLDAGVISVLATHRKVRAVEGELDKCGSVLLDADAIVEVELTGGSAVKAEGDDDLKVLGAEIGGGHGAVEALGDNHAAAVVELDGFVVDIFDEDVGAMALHGLVGVEVVEDVIGEVD